MAQQMNESGMLSSVNGSPAKGKVIRFAPSAKSGSTKFGKSTIQMEPKRTRAILSDEHEQN